VFRIRKPKKHSAKKKTDISLGCDRPPIPDVRDLFSSFLGDSLCP
jgi:hypothetical protein